MKDSIGFCAVSLAARVAIAGDGEEFPITNMYDAFGDETDDEDEAISLIVRVSEDLWVVIDMTEFEDALLH